MSADIFISYRRGDYDSLWANLLNEALEEKFDVYFDTSRQSNELGDDFVRGLDAALADCRVMLVLMGQDWIKAVQRLHEPEDWVRAEILAALARPQVTLVPLFLGFDGQPDLSGLPEVLADLKTRNGAPLNPRNWERESADLITQLSKRLSVSRGGISTSAPLPPTLPFLCNRTTQEEALVDLVRACPAREPIVCLLHGHKWEAHDEFLDRVRDQGVLDEILGAHEVGVAIHSIRVNRERLRTGPAVDPLKSALKAALLGRRTATDDELRIHFDRLEQPLIAVLQLTWLDFEQAGQSLIGNLAAAWTTIASAANASASQRNRAVLWINLTYDDLETTLPTGAPIEPLPKLRAVEAVDIRDWLGLADVKRRVSQAKRGQIQDLADLPAYAFEAGKLHMRRFAEGVGDVMSRP